MSNDDTKVTDLAEQRKKRMPVAQTKLRDVHDIIGELITTLEAHGSKRLIGSYMGGWTFSIERSDKENQ